MRDLRRQVEHVAAREHVVVARREAAEDLERQASPEREVLLPPVAPAPPSHALQQEHVVRVDMRADAAARGRVAHHQVVEARERQEVEAAQQAIGARVVKVGSLHEQRPARLRQRSPAGAAKRPARQRESRSVAHHEARLDVVALGQRTQLRPCEQIVERGQCAAHQQRALVPVARDKCARGEAWRQWRTCGIGHAARGCGVGSR